MFSSLLGAVMRPLNDAVHDAVRLAGWSVAIAFAALLAFFFFLAAAFVWTEQRYGTLEAAVLFGAFFLVAAGALLIVLMVSRRRASKRLPPASVPPLWKDPAVLAVAVEIARHVKVRRTIPAIALGAIIVALLQSGPARKPR